MGTTLRHIIYDIGGGIKKGSLLRQCRSEDRPADVWLKNIWMNHLTLIPSRSSMRSLVLADWLLWTKIPVWLMSQNSLWALRSRESCGKCGMPNRNKAYAGTASEDRRGQGENRTWINWKRLQNLFSPFTLWTWKSAPLPVISTLQNFRDEYEEHIVEGKCRAHVCEAMKIYEIDPDRCKGCYRSVPATVR